MKVVVFGAGYWGKNYIRELGRHCVLVVDSDSAAREEAMARFKIKATPELPHNLDFDGAIIATPPGEHYITALPLLRNNKYVLVEKPLSLSHADALVLAAYDKCMGSLVYLYHPEVERLKETVAEMELSHIFSRRTNDGPIRPDVDALWDLAPHDISIFNYIFGKAPNIPLKALRNRNYATFSLDYGGIPAISYVSWHGGPKMRQVELVPRGGQRIIFDDLAIVLEEPPLTRMVKAFLSGQWDRCYGWQAAEVIKILEALS